MAKVVSISELSRLARDGARIVKREKPNPFAAEIERLRADLQALAERPAPVPQPVVMPDLPPVPTAAEIAALVHVPAPVLPDLPPADDVQDVTYDERGRLRIKLKSGKQFEVRISGTTTVVQSGPTLSTVVVNPDNTLTFTFSDGSTIDSTGAINVPFDDYSEVEYLADQTSAGTVLTFSFVNGPVQKVWVEMQAADADDTSTGRVRVDGTDPTATVGTLLHAGQVQPISSPPTSTVKVLAPSGKVVSVYGYRR